MVYAKLAQPTELTHQFKTVPANDYRTCWTFFESHLKSHSIGGGYDDGRSLKGHAGGGRAAVLFSTRNQTIGGNWSAAR